MSFNGSASREAHELHGRILAENAGFTAAFCMNDFIAVGVLEAVTEAGCEYRKTSRSSASTICPAR
jgi:DNA-binding LacI/PurR family transcriptional regulator